MLSDGGRATDDEERLTGILATSAFFPSKLESKTKRLLKVEADTSGRECRRNRRRLVETNVIRNLRDDFGGYDRVLLECGALMGQVALMKSGMMLGSSVALSKINAVYIHSVSNGKVCDAGSDGLHDPCSI